MSVALLLLVLFLTVGLGIAVLSAILIWFRCWRTLAVLLGLGLLVLASAGYVSLLGIRQMRSDFGGSPMIVHMEPLPRSDADRAREDPVAPAVVHLEPTAPVRRAVVSRPVSDPADETSLVAATTETAPEPQQPAKKAKVQVEMSAAERACRPTWVEAPAKLTDKGYQMVVTAGPYTTDMECQHALPERVKEAVAEYAQLYLGAQWRQLPLLPDGFLAADPDLMAQTHRETITTSVGPMQQLHARLLLGKKLNRWLDEQLRAAIVGRRLMIAATVSGLVLLSIGAAWAVARRAASRTSDVRGGI